MCFSLQAFFSPNKFIFHCHSATETGLKSNLTTYRHPDAANFNAWRRHLHLADPNPPDTLLFTWEDIKAMFNGGNRTKKPHLLPLPPSCQPLTSEPCRAISDTNASKTSDIPIKASILSPPHALLGSLVGPRAAPLGCSGEFGGLWWLGGSQPQLPCLAGGGMFSLWTAQLQEYVGKITQGIFIPPPPPPSSYLPSSSTSSTSAI